MSKIRGKPRGMKIITLGNKEVGKSCVLRRYCEKRFISKYVATIGIDYGIIKTMIGDIDLRVNIFDLSGNPIFHEVRKEFYGDCNGVLLVYDVGKRSSFDSLDLWLKEMTKFTNNHCFESMIFVVCGNKCDKKREIDESEGRLWAQLHGFLFFETSAYTGEGVHNMFQCIFISILKLLEGGAHPIALRSQGDCSKEQVEAIRRLHWARDEYEKLGLHFGASREEINKVYRRLAVLLHPDKSNVPGSEEAFKTLVATRLSLLRHLPH